MTEAVLVGSLVLITAAVVIAFVVGGLGGTSKDSSVIESMRSLRKESEIFYLENGRSYKDFCLTDIVGKLNRRIDNFVCFDKANEGSFGTWAAEYKLITKEKYYCVDYTGKDGFSKESSISHEDFLCDLEKKEKEPVEEDPIARARNDYLK